MEIERPRRRERLRKAAFTYLFGAFTLAVVANAQVFTPDLIVRPGSNNKNGYVTNGSGQNVYGSAGSFQGYPLVWALRNAGTGVHGRKILVKAGHYSNMVFRIGDNGPHAVNVPLHSTALSPIIVRGETDASGALLSIIDGVYTNYSGDTVGVTGGGFNFLQWHFMKFMGSGRTTFILGSSGFVLAGGTYDGWEFHDCVIDGGYNAKTYQGLRAKWGFQLYGMKNFLWERGEIFGISDEHAFYFHNAQGDVTIQNGKFHELGRTFAQFCARIDEYGVQPLPENHGKITLKNNIIADTGISPTDAFAGGQAITITGRNRGPVEISGNQITFGLDTFVPGLKAALLAHPAYPPGKPYGQGSLVTWTPGAENYENVGPALIINNSMKYCSSCAATLYP